MKILCLLDSISRANGGIFEAERRLQQTLAEDRKVTVQVLGLHDEFAAEDFCAWLPLEPKAFPTYGPGGFGFSPGLRRAVSSAEADLAYCAGLWKYPSFLSLQWARRTRKPLVVAPHGMLDRWALNQSRGRKRLARLLYQNAQLEIAGCIRALCESEARAIRKLGLKNPICIIPNGIDLPQSEAQGAERRAQRKVLLYLGRIHPKKGLINLLRAWRLALTNSPSAAQEWVLAIAGWDQSGHEAELKQLATQLGLEWSEPGAWCPPFRVSGANSTPVEGRGAKDAGGAQGGKYLQPATFNLQPSTIVFLGPQFGEAKAQCYRDCDAFILPSLSEGVPMVVLEAWAWQKPVLMTPECNLPDGFVASAAIRVEPNVPSLVAGLGRLFEMGPSELRAMGSAGYQLTASRYVWPRVAEQMKGLYEWQLGGGPKPACLWAVNK